MYSKPAPLPTAHPKLVAQTTQIAYLVLEILINSQNVTYCGGQIRSKIGSGKTSKDLTDYSQANIPSTNLATGPSIFYSFARSSLSCCGLCCL